MKLKAAGKNISKIEVTNISPFGIWLLFCEKEYFLPYTEFPWFKDSKVADITNVKLLNDNHIHWPSIDVELETDILENLEKYPLLFGNCTTTR